MKIKILAVGEQSQEIARILPPGNNDNVFNACVHEGLDRIEHHRPVIHWQGRLVSYSCGRIKTGPLPPPQNGPPHLSIYSLRVNTPPPRQETVSPEAIG